MGPVILPNGFCLPKRPSHHNFESLAALTRSSGVISPGENEQDVVDNEIMNWAGVEWSIVTRAAKKMADEIGLSAQDWLLVMHELRERHKAVWGPYGNDRARDKG